MGMRMYPQTTSVSITEQLVGVVAGTAATLARLNALSLKELASEQVLRIYAMGFMDQEAAYQEMVDYVAADDDFARYKIMNNVFHFVKKYDEFDLFGWGKPNDACYRLLERLEKSSEKGSDIDIDLDHGSAFIKDRSCILDLLTAQKVIRDGMSGFSQEMFDGITSLNFS